MLSYDYIIYTSVCLEASRLHASTILNEHQISVGRHIDRVKERERETYSEKQ